MTFLSTKNTPLATLTTAALVGAFALSLGARAQDTPSQATQPEDVPEELLASMTPLRGIDVAVRKPGEDEFSDSTSRMAIEAFRDEDFGTLVYMTGSGDMATMKQPANFELRHLPFERFYETVRFSPVAGVAWRLNLRTAKWQLIEEPEPLMPGNYEIDMFHVTSESMVAMRIDELTGQTWTLVSEEGQADRWEPIAEPDVEPNAASSDEAK